ncbi:HNH endonuclease [Cryobacterium sp. Sr8]|uniref:HNH endonuclease signature motif containing protein n=1 Tax=Cryobacterium sp. Sr8 TaxID=1259203 RepID=UPI00106AEC7A|nr:HNH endonuclease signature motif containing protein [Cryobacterium sp. Sr8]TFD80631.1 HNH endonuclease [Cryobacterium sp. Sr8]
MDPRDALSAATIDDLVDAVVAADRQLASVSAHRAVLIDEARRRSEARRSDAPRAPGARWDAGTVARRELVSELACALRLPQRSMETLLAESEVLVHELPATMSALRAGEISYRHAKAMIDHAGSLPAESRKEFEEALLPQARRLTVAKFDGTARKARERTHPETIRTRHEKCAGDRAVQLVPARDGMAWLNAYLPTATAHSIYNRISDLAISLQRPDETRTLTQLRADVLSELLIDGVGAPGTPSAGLGQGVRATVLITVPVMTLLGHSEEPGHLEGYGPIDPETARRLAAKAPSFIRILTHPETGCVLSVGRSRYKVPKDLRRWLRVRDETCRFPGCNRSASRCDIDHGLDWQFGGRTDSDNLPNLCPPDHDLKSETGWSVKHARDGTLNWTSPGGRTYSTDPATPMGPAPPPPF